MADINTVFNDQMELFGLRYITKVAPIPYSPEHTKEKQRQQLLASFFEQLLLFDSVAVKLERSNLGLYFLINELGIDRVESLIERNTIKLILWTPMLLSSTGRKGDDGIFDATAVIGTPPLVTGHYISSDLDPEKNIETALNYFNFNRERKRKFIRTVRDKYLYPNDELVGIASNVVIDAYCKNRLEELGLKYEKEPNNLDANERGLLQRLGHDVLDTSVLAKFQFKSYNKYSIYNITESSVKEIESALKISQNTSQILKIENVPDISSLVLSNVIPFDLVFDIRHRATVKHYRKWINNLSNSEDALPITKEYIDEITGKNKFFNTSGGKFIRNVGLFGIGAGIGAVVGGLQNAAIGGVIAKAADFSLGLFDTYILDGLLKGWNPQMFVDEIRQHQIKP